MNPKELVMLEFEGIRIPTLFKITLWELRTPLIW